MQPSQKEDGNYVFFGSCLLKSINVSYLQVLVEMQDGGTIVVTTENTMQRLTCSVVNTFPMKVARTSSKCLVAKELWPVITLRSIRNDLQFHTLEYISWFFHKGLNKSIKTVEVFDFPGLLLNENTNGE